MKRHDDYILISVVIFIMITIVIYIFSLLFKFEFLELDRIILAITISSYFLSIAEIKECSVDFEYKKYVYTKDVYDEYLKKLYEFKEEMGVLKDCLQERYKEDGDEKEIEIINSVKNSYEKSIRIEDEAINTIEEIKESYLKQANSYAKKSFIYKTISFLLLFCFLTFEKFCAIFESSSTIYCLGAFLFVVLVMALKSRYNIMLEEYKKEKKQNVEKLINDINQTQDKIKGIYKRLN